LFDMKASVLVFSELSGILQMSPKGFLRFRRVLTRPPGGADDCRNVALANGGRGTDLAILYALAGKTLADGSTGRNG
jgi:hypothetical protein